MGIKLDVSEVVYSVGRTISTGNYESVRVDVSETARVGKGQPVDECFELLKEDVEKKFNDVVAEVTESLGSASAPRKGVTSKPAPKTGAGVRRRN